ncbi:MAG: 50S ribosomal protein L3 N(5)-glutamine methyltransferase [Hyphomicrobiaceae bacterium]|nr:50S ribosomal protein L3 N(5)-glutamine methyltransferase [Hyphomicrobiaceae bacterium]
MTESAGRLAELATLRDWLRFAVSRFNRAGLVYGHGTERALDEAAFIVLATLDLDPDDLDPWLDARLTPSERARLDAVIEARVATRRPAPYLVGRAYIRGHRFKCDPRAIVPRSFIGELLCDVLEEGPTHAPAFAVEAPPARILDLCTGGGSLAILAAMAFSGAVVDAVDISSEALALAAENVAAYGLGDRVRLIEGDLFGGLAEGRYDLIISNPPYVTDASVAAFPPEHRAEPVLAHAGGPDGLDIVRRILAEAGSHLEPHGRLVVEVGAGRNAVSASFPDLPFAWIDTTTATGEVLALPAASLQPGAKATSAPRRKDRKQSS